MYSAIKVKGQKLYEIARRGGEVERQPRRITIHELKVAGRDGEDYLLDIRCSKGTYVRTLCHDIGRTLGCGGCMSSLRRTRAGEFRLEDAHTLDEVQKAADAGQLESLLLPVDTLFDEEKATITGKAEAILRDALLPYVPKEPITDKPIALKVLWEFPYPKSAKKHKKGHCRHKITRPDTDNLNKMLKDVMTDMGFWKDDALISMEWIWKVLSDEPGIWISIEEMNIEIPYEEGEADEES
jgi:Holliday junction resolvase RusA-like endonuclease